MLGLMQAPALTTGMLIDHAARWHGDVPIVSAEAGGGVTRTTWREIARDARRLAAGLRERGFADGDRVATLAWNRAAHLVCYYGVSAGGMVLHTVNPRLFGAQIVHIVGDGGARIVFVDPDLVAVLMPLLADLPAVATVVVMGDGEPGIDAPAGVEVLRWSDILSPMPLAEWPALDERQASNLCHTSGTTGAPKGVLYSHRSTVLHAYAALGADAMALSARDTALLVTPMFHVNAWGVPFAAAMAGTGLVLPGAALDGASIWRWLHEEGVTFTLGVPTVWFALLDHVDTLPKGDRVVSLGRVFCGGAAAPAALIERFHRLLGVEVVQAWGMTETSPVATVSRPTARHRQLPLDDRLGLAALQGRPLCGVDLRLLDAEGREVAFGDGASGALMVRGAWVLDAYLGQAPGAALDADGWFDTGDIATIDRDGFLRITDRAKDVIKSGGEWISSIEVENAALEHPWVAEAAVVAVPHPRWQERPLLLVRPAPGVEAGAIEGAMHDFLAARLARWWVPDACIVVDELPKGATGKVRKDVLRSTYATGTM